MRSIAVLIGHFGRPAIAGRSSYNGKTPTMAIADRLMWRSSSGTRYWGRTVINGDDSVSIAWTDNPSYLW